MKRSSKVIVGMMVLVLPLVLTACGGKKQPETVEPPAPAPVEQPAQEVSEPVQPPTQMDETPDPFSEDLQTANDYARSQGLLGDVHFEFDRYSLTADARDRLARNAQFMKEHPGFKFTIEGHCDERGTNEYNIALGQNRVGAAIDYLSSLGVDTARFKGISYGEERPVCTESDESCWWRNRRAHFVITALD